MAPGGQFFQWKIYRSFSSGHGGKRELGTDVENLHGIPTLQIRNNFCILNLMITGSMPPLKLKRLGTLGRKQLLALRNYSTPLKLLNLLRCEMEKRAGAVKTRAMPYTAIIELTNACNLHCPGCPTGLGIEGRPIGILDLRQLRTFLDQTADYLLIANLFNWGESLLHPRAAEIVKLVHERGIFTSISSNLNIGDPHMLEDLCDAGLDHLVVSADGASGATYNAYRRGGDFNLVLSNIRHLVACRKRKRKMSPIIEWQLLAFRHLEPEIAAASCLAEEIGADWFTVRGAVAPLKYQPADPLLRGRFYDGKQHCDFLWYTITLQSDGGISPCCMIYDERDDFGHIERATVREVRNNERYRTARQFFASRENTVKDLDHPCLRCPMVHRQKHLAGFFARHPELFTDDGFQSVIANADDLKNIAGNYTMD
jgi:MoaA/NifB/PqqE/SkfB family radical SAM enzyme